MSLDAQSQALVDALNASGVLPFRRFNPAQVRELILKLRSPRPAAPTHEMSGVANETITTVDGSFVVRVLQPPSASITAARAAVIYFHGGGFFAGGIDETDELARTIAFQTGAVVFNVDYHLSPEARFPVAVNDAYSALCWVAEHAARFGIDRDRIVLAGDSAGGNLTIVTCLMARERGGPAIRLQVPIYPSVDLRARPHYPSRARWGGGGYILDNDDIEWMLDHYLNHRGEGDDWRASPILATSYVGLPPALVITAGHDPLCDEGKAYADRLQADGVTTEYVCFESSFHGFVGYASALEVAARAVGVICERIKQAVG